MLPWKSIIQIQKDSQTPVYLQVAGAISMEIKRGRIGPGIQLPGSRQLAGSLNIHRQTIVRAYQELEAQGWIELRPSQGTFTSRELPEAKPRRLAEGKPTPTAYPAETGYTVPVNTWIKPPGNPLRQIIGFHEGPDARLMPTYELAKAFRSVLAKKVNLRYTSYVEAAGVEKFRRILSDYLNSTRGLKTTFENVMITRGGTMGLYLIVMTLFKKGDVVIVGDPNYYYADKTFLHAGMQLIRVKVDDHGIDVAAIEKISRRKKISAVFITPHHHFPTTVTLSASRRMHLLDLAGTAGFVIIEDDYDFDFHYQSSPILPLVSADDKGMVIYIGTLSKTMALADLFQDGTIKRTLKKALKEYRLRRDFVCAALSARLSDKIEFSVPDDGLYHNTAPTSLNATRIGFGWMTIREAERAIHILHATIRSTV
jgi:GntR family transcriptional regulator/MocR family aminotransferase